MKVIGYLAGMALVLASSTAVFAGEVVISGSGTWGSSDPTTTYSAPDAAFSFSFDLPNPIASDPTTEATDFSYSLNGSVIATSVNSVTFYAIALKGMFDLDFPDEVVSIYGADIGSSLTISTGVYSVTGGLSGGPGGLTGTVTVSSGSAAPESSTWAMMLIGFAGLGYAGFHSRRRISVAA